ncbi:MAG: hypothetical protein OXH92_20685, partial [Bryobacterales bacterium]|nr:hypothetical protein [Bryobacterales bacterium]
MNARPSVDRLFERPIGYPDVDPQERLARLVGLDEQKTRLTKLLAFLVNPNGLQAWAQQHQPGAVSAGSVSDGGVFGLFDGR